MSYVQQQQQTPVGFQYTQSYMRQPEAVLIDGGGVVPMQTHTASTVTVNVSRWKNMTDVKSILMTSIREGTAAFLFGIVQYAVATNGGLDRGYIAIATGLAYAAVSFLFGGVFINPMFSLAAVFCRRLSILKFLANVVSQFIGFILAAVTVGYGFTLDMGLAVPTTGPFGTTAGFIAEFIGTYCICLCVVAIGDDTYWKIRPAFIGAMYGAITFAIGPITTACFNPFLIVCASILSFFNSEAWFFCVAPVVGALGAAIMAWVLHLQHIHKGEWVLEPKKQ